MPAVTKPYKTTLDVLDAGVQFAEDEQDPCELLVVQYVLLVLLEHGDDGGRVLDLRHEHVQLRTGALGVLLDFLVQLHVLEVVVPLRVLLLRQGVVLHRLLDLNELSDVLVVVVVVVQHRRFPFRHV